MDPTRRPGIARLLALISCLASPAASSKELVYGEPYGCNGDRFVVAYCRGDSDTGGYVTNPLDNYCNVTYIDRPRRNGFLPEAGVLRGDILKKIVACEGGATATKPPASKGNDIVVPGTGGAKVALLRLPESRNSTIVRYIDELSRKPAAGTDDVAIWSLLVYPQGVAKPVWPAETARWIEYRFDCRNGTFDANVMIGLDRQAKALGAAALNEKNQKVNAGTLGATMADTACRTGAAASGPRLTSTIAAIEDAMKPASAAVAVAASPATTAATNPKDIEARADALIDAWTAAYVRKDYDAALAHMHEYSKLYPQDANGYVWAAQTYRAKGDDAGAERAYLQAQRLAPQDATVNLAVGKFFLDVHEDKVRARTEALKVVSLKSAKSDQLIPAGELLWQADDGQSAREAFRRGVQLPGEPPMLARGWVGFGRSQWKEGKLPQAIVALKEGMRLDPKNVDAHYALSGVYEDQGNLAGVLAERQAIARMEPSDAWAFYSLGNAYAAVNQMAPAVAAYDKVLEMAQKDTHAQDLLSLLSDSYEEVGRPDRAIAALRTALALPSDGTQEGIESKLMSDFFHCGRLAWLLVGQKQYPEVVRINFARGPCNGIVAQEPLGIAYVALNQPQKAVPQLEKGLEGFEKSIAEYERELSDAKLAKDQRELKTELLSDLKSESSQSLHALGRAYLATGRKADAQRTARTLQRYDANLAAQLTAEIGEKP